MEQIGLKEKKPQNSNCSISSKPGTTFQPSLRREKAKKGSILNVSTVSWRTFLQSARKSQMLQLEKTF